MDIAETSFQLSPEEWSNLCQSYQLWREEQWRLRKMQSPYLVRGGNHMPWERLKKIIRLFYEGWGQREILYLIGTSKSAVSIGNQWGHFKRFLSENPAFNPPLCKCGKPLFHKPYCPIRDSHMPAAQKKGKEAQRRLAQERYADGFFQVTHQTHTMHAIATPLIETQASSFASLVQQGIEAWTKAGALLVEMIEANPDARNIIIERCPDITEEILARFEAIGRKQIHPQTLLNNSPGMRRLRRLPYSEQERYINQPVELLIRTSTGTDKLKVAVKNLTAAQSLQVFCPNGVRSPEAQRAYLESAYKPKATNGSAPYKVSGNKVRFTQGCEMNAKELLAVLSQIS